MNESNYPPMMYIENTNSLENLLFDKDAEGLHLFCSFNREELSKVRRLKVSLPSSFTFFMRVLIG